MIPCPKDTVSNLHFFHSKLCGWPISSNSKSIAFKSPRFSIKFLNLVSPIFLAIIKEPIFEDLIRISSTDKLSGKSCISPIVCIEHLTLSGILSIIVCGDKMFSSRASAIVNVLKTDPSSKTPFVI